MNSLLIRFTHSRQNVSSEKTSGTCNKINILMDKSSTSSSLLEPKVVETEKVLNGVIRALRDHL